MATSQNGWPASQTLKRRDLVVNGATFVGGIVDNQNVYDVFHYLLTEYAKRVEPLMTQPGCWGWYYRANRNDPTSLSNHSSGTAIDVNAPKHPNGVATSKTFTAKQIAEVHKILDELDGVVRWGGDYTHTVDAMHFEINVPPGHLQEIGAKLRKKAAPKPVVDPVSTLAPGEKVTSLAAINQHGSKREKAALAQFAKNHGLKVTEHAKIIRHLNVLRATGKLGETGRAVFYAAHGWHKKALAELDRRDAK